MKSKFAPLTKLKKKKLDDLRHLFLNANKKITKLQNELTIFKQDLKNQTIPQSGFVFLLNQYTLLAQTCHNQIIKKKDELYHAQQDRKKIQQMVSEALIEYEKFHYLHIEEIKTLKEKIKKQEALELDEIAIMGYNQKR